MRILMLAMFSTALLHADPPLVIPHVADGGGWSSTVAIFNGFSVNPTHLLINFRGSDGQKIPFPISNVGTVSSLEVELAPGSSIYLETPGTRPNAQVGWVEVNQLSGTTPVRGFAVFRQIVPGRPDFEAVSIGMRAAASMTFPFDNTNGLVTSFAVVNLSAASCTVAVSPLFDEFGNALSVEPKLVGNLLANGHTSFVSTDKMPELANKRGYVTFTPQIGCGAGGFAMVGLRFNPSGSFTNLTPLGITTP